MDWIIRVFRFSCFFLESSFHVITEGLRVDALRVLLWSENLARLGTGGSAGGLIPRSSCN